MAPDTELRYFVFWAAMDYERVVQFYTSCLECEVVETVKTESSVYVSLKDKNQDVNKPVLLKFKFAKDKLKGFPRSEKVQRVKDQPHMVFYAKDVESITTRIACSNTGAWVFVEPREVVGGVKVAVAIDPSGYTIRLVGLAQEKLCRESVKRHQPSMQRAAGGKRFRRAPEHVLHVRQCQGTQTQTMIDPANNSLNPARSSCSRAVGRFSRD